MGSIPWVRQQPPTVRAFEATNITWIPAKVLNKLAIHVAARAAWVHRFGYSPIFFYSQLGAADSRTGPDGFLTGFSAGVTSKYRPSNDPGLCAIASGAKKRRSQARPVQP